MQAIKKIALLLLISSKLDAQGSYASIFVAGLADGTAETLKFHYGRFDQKFNANDDYWNPELSWRNKYGQNLEPRFPGSTTFLVWTTDGYHLTRTIRNVATITSIGLYKKKNKNWKVIARDVALHLLAYQAGFYVTYNLIYR